MAKGLTVRSLEELAAAHHIENVHAHRAAGDVATLIALLSHQRGRRKPYLYELLRNAGIVQPRGRSA
jgi:exonuclease I